MTASAALTLLSLALLAGIALASLPVLATPHACADCILTMEDRP